LNAGLYRSGTNFGNASMVYWAGADWQGITNGTTAPMTINPGGTFWTAYDGFESVSSNITVASGGTLMIDTGGGNNGVYTERPRHCPCNGGLKRQRLFGRPLGI
jgi:hypothetical protein